MNAMFSIQYRGASDAGMGVLVLQSGRVFGIDVGGLKYDGTYTQRPGSTTVDLQLQLTAPPGGGRLVTGQVIPAGQSFAVTASFDAGKPTSTITVQVPGGAVTVNATRLRDVPA